MNRAKCTLTSASSRTTRTNADSLTAKRFGRSRGMRPYVKMRIYYACVRGGTFSAVRNHRASADVWPLFVYLETKGFSDGDSVFRDRRGRRLRARRPARLRAGH